MVVEEEWTLAERILLLWAPSILVSLHELKYFSELRFTLPPWRPANRVYSQLFEIYR